MKTKKCPACGEIIAFIETTKGAQMPINPDKKVTVITLLGQTVTGFIPHWAECKGASRFRKRDKGKA